MVFLWRNSDNSDKAERITRTASHQIEHFDSLSAIKVFPYR